MTLSKLRRFPIGRLTSLPACLLIVALLALSTTATAEDVWDAAAVIRLANELEATMQQAYEGSLVAPPQETAIQQRIRDSTQSNIERARDLSADYARRMRDGWTRAESEPMFQSLLESVAQIWKTGEGAKPAESAKPLLDRINSILDELRRRYDDASQANEGSVSR